MTHPTEWSAWRPSIRTRDQSHEDCCQMIVWLYGSLIERREHNAADLQKWRELGVKKA